METQSDRFPENPFGKAQEVLDYPVRIAGHDRLDVTAAEASKLLNHVFCMKRRLFNLGDVLEYGRLGRGAGLNRLLLQDFRVSENDLGQVREVVGDPTGQPSERHHFRETIGGGRLERRFEHLENTSVAVVPVAGDECSHREFPSPEWNHGDAVVRGIHKPDGFG